MGKVILISIDGMRPDGLKMCGNAYLEEMMKNSSYTFCARTVFPSITLPCHLSLFHSVPPERHGTLNNTYVVPVRPVNGLFEQVHYAQKKAAMFYGWEQIRDVYRPGSCRASEYINAYMFENVDGMLTDSALKCIKTLNPDFVFLYLVETDEKGGHYCGWMSEGYLARINYAFDCVKRVVEEAGDEYTVIVTADHGGHDRIHGTDMDEDMTIPMFFRGPDFEKNKELEGVSILDIAPTIAKILEVAASPEWEGKVLFNVE